MALCDATKEAKFLDMLLNDFLPDVSFRHFLYFRIHVDNTGAIALGKNNMVTKRSKHIDIRYHFTRECFNDGLIDILHVDSEENIADIFTKPLGRPKYQYFGRVLFGEQ